MGWCESIFGWRRWMGKGGWDGVWYDKIGLGRLGRNLFCIVRRMFRSLSFFVWYKKTNNRGAALWTNCYCVFFVFLLLESGVHVLFVSIVLGEVLDTILTPHCWIQDGKYGYSPYLNSFSKLHCPIQNPQNLHPPQTPTHPYKNLFCVIYYNLHLWYFKRIQQKMIKKKNIGFFFYHLPFLHFSVPFFLFETLIVEFEFIDAETYSAHPTSHTAFHYPSPTKPTLQTVQKREFVMTVLSLFRFVPISLSQYSSYIHIFFIIFCRMWTMNMWSLIGCWMDMWGWKWILLE